MLSSVLRKLGMISAFASAVLVSTLAGVASVPAGAQLYSEGYEFLKAVRDREGDVVTEMLNQPGTQVVNARDITSGDTGLHIVAERRDPVWIGFLLQRGANPNIQNKKGQTPIQISTALGDVDSVERLIKGGANVNVSDQQGETPLISAVHARNIALIATFLEKGADPDRSDNSGRSARHYARLLSSNSQIMDEFAAADAKREEQGTADAYGPSF